MTHEMLRRAVASFAVAATFAMVGCTTDHARPAEPTPDARLTATDRPEMVMTAGTVITARNGNGEIRITAGNGLRRTYAWGDHKKTVTLTPRTSRWNGSLGAYDPADTWFRVRASVVANEGRQFFDSVDEAMSWLLGGSNVNLPVWTPDGLVVGRSGGADPSNGQEWRIGVNVYQLYIKGEKPTDLPGARPDLIRVDGGQTARFAIPNEAPVGYKRIEGPPRGARLVLDIPYSPLTGSGN